MAAALAMPAAVSAQQRPAEGRPADEAFKMVDAYLIANIQESLELTDEQFVRLLPLIKRQQTERRDSTQSRQRALRDLGLAIRDGATEQSLVAALDRLEQLDAESFEARNQRYAEIDAELSPIQQAKLRIFEFEVERRMRDLMRRVRGEQQPRQRRDFQPRTPPR
jgi:Spy/CpxP family protein refolding chaperone